MLDYIINIFKGKAPTGTEKPGHASINKHQKALKQTKKITLETNIEIPPDFDFNEDFRQAFDSMENTNKYIFVTGKAGTGKSTLLQYFKLKTKKKIAILAPTGVAAIKVHGQTIHSFFNLPPRFIQKSHIKRLRKEELIKKLDAIVIDEASMLRADLLDGIDYALRVNRENYETPFGGVQIILFADLFQLPAVVDKDIREVMKKTYASPYFFDAKVFKETLPEKIILNKIYRQKDEDFIRILNKIRFQKCDENALEILNQRVNAKVGLGLSGVITLTTTNNGAKNINEQCLSRINDKEHLYRARVTGKFKEDEYPAEACLRLKRKAQVMLIKNDIDKRWVNGTLAEIVALSASGIKVRVGNNIHEIPKITWEKVEYKFNEEEQKIEENVIGTFQQYPIKLAWAVTIHKSQGQTFTSVIIDMGWGAFAHGQTYVALSRCTSLEGITLKKPLIPSDIMFDERIYRFLDSKEENNINESNLEKDLGTQYKPKYSEGQFVTLKEDGKSYRVIGPFPKDDNKEQEYRLEHMDVKENEILKLDPNTQKKEFNYSRLEEMQALAKPNAENRIAITLTSDPYDNKSCTFDIHATSQESKELVLEVNRWTYTKVRSKTAYRKLNIISSTSMTLIIEGEGFDNRCRWCRTFRTGLRTSAEKRFGEKAFIQRGVCQYG